MKKLLLALFLVGCGGEGAGVNYDVRIGALDPPRCAGYMHLGDNAADVGYWRCYLIGGEAHVDLNTPGVVFLNLETTPGMLNQVRAVADGDNITGQIFLDGDPVAFFATRQQDQ